MEERVQCSTSDAWEKSIVGQAHRLPSSRIGSRSRPFYNGCFSEGCTCDSSLCRLIREIRAIRGFVF